ncbi:S26 family signal peptidase [Pseudoduganella umbonata]|uniref:Conjugal transfer pilin signal peptidase TrbI n=1 Tax=Pseudoduganella umbonata TaxID=864828 RepID=A0A4P8HLD0_9BURK|nr:S26 family signal peptidase [Pseudoduganella umbonata]MBB3221711.1 conjugal transfer pilin signal peptidase TrbI [Pseudoduganella umbonata]QCP09068.1 hypothetical protein FCL38_00420 [Pseudoduganella umbonata]
MRIITPTSTRLVIVGLGQHLRRRWPRYAAGVVLFGWCSLHYRLGINHSASLPGRLYLIELNVQPRRNGELVVFRWQRNAFFRPDRLFLKEIRGIAGQRIDVVGRNVYVNGKFQGVAKTASRRGTPLTPVAAGTIPCGYLYVGTAHPDSLDSRYAVTGLIGPDRIVGRAHVLF